MMRQPNIASGCPTFLSLFSGCGGFDTGFLEAGYRCLGALDIDPLVLATHHANFGTPTYVQDLAGGNLQQTLDGSADLILAGSPCQGFSTAGKRDIDDPRNHLLVAASKIAVQLRPKVFVAENVAGVTSGLHRRYWDAAESLLRLAGYKTESVKIQTTDLGMGQIRKRVLLFAWRVDRTPCLEIQRRPPQTLKDVLASLPVDGKQDAVLLPEESKLARIALHIAPGQKLSNVRCGPKAIATWDIPAVYGETTSLERTILCAIRRLRRQKRVRSCGDADPVLRSSLREELGLEDLKPVDSLIERGYLRKVGRRIDLTNTFNGKFRKLSWNSPSLTVDTRFGDPRYFLHPDENRGFSPREAARLQGFSDEFLVSGPTRLRFRMIGNAVPPPLSRQVASMVTPLLVGAPR